MAKTKAQKQATLDRLTDAFKSGFPAVFVHFKGITVADESAMRRSLKGDNVSYLVAKKTLIGKALKESGVPGTEPELQGEVAVAYANAAGDETLPARVLQSFSKQFGAERFALLGGIFEKALQGKDAIIAVASIPPVSVLRGMFANVINSPRQRFAVVLSKVAEVKQ